MAIVVIISHTIGERAEEITTIEVVEEVEDLMVNHLNILISINFKNLSLMLQVQGQRGQLIRSVESLDTWQLIVIIGWIMPIKASIHLPNLLQWPLHPMLVLLRSSLG